MSDGKKPEKAAKGKIVMGGGVAVEYTILTQKGFNKEVRLTAEATWDGQPIAGEPRKTQRAAELSLKRAIASKIETDQKIQADRKRLDRWNRGLAKSFEAD